MELLSLDDFKDTRFDPNWSPFDYLLQVAKVGKEKMQKQNFKIRIGEEKKRHDFGYLKYFLYNAPEPQTLCKEENMGFKLSVNKNVGLKRKRKLKEDEDEDGEWEGLKLKLKRSKKEKPVCPIPFPPPDLPDNFKQHIVEKMGGSSWVLVIQKPIFYSDVNPQASRFSIPFSQLKTREFLNKTEAEDLDHKKGIEVCLLEPSMKETTLTFNRWDMVKSSSYVMTTTWNPVVKNNRLKIDDIVQLWSFRVKSKLCFALLKVQVPTRN